MATLPSNTRHPQNKLINSHSYRKSVKRSIEMQGTYQGFKATKPQREACKYFAIPMGGFAKAE